MGRSNTYLVDRARIMKVKPTINMGVVSREELREPYGDWINARLRPVSGNETVENAQVKLTYSHELILHRYDMSGNEICVDESDEFEIMVSRNNTLTKSLDAFAIAGAIYEVRKRTVVQSYVIPLELTTEF